MLKKPLSAVRKPSDAALRKLDALATLPVFFTLTGKRVVVAGASEAAAWKAELLAAAGAQVDVFASSLSAEMSALLSRGAAAGRLTLHDRPWDGGCFAHAVLGVCDAASDGEAQAFACAAKAAGVPANVIDRPRYCTFQFGSIVNRSPVVVGISTAGAAPILGQAIRRRIETLLPPALKDWADLAAAVRSQVIARLAPGPQRRAFWERFAERALSSRAPEALDDLFARADAVPDAGRVTLVGAGPGDAGLLTLNAVRALQACDVILFDDLVSDEVLELARREAKRIAVGKRGARASCRQGDITQLMVDLAQKGRNVVRLKSGDPMIFGRAGEEIGALQAAGIEVSVVPGVTSAAAMAAQLKTSLTHREHAQVLSFVTGHSRHGGLPDDVDIPATMGPGRTTVVYMGAMTSPLWVERALAANVSPATPAVVMASATRTDETVWQGTLAALPAAVERFGDGPVLIGVGEAFAAASVAATAPTTAHSSLPSVVAAAQ